MGLEASLWGLHQSRTLVAAQELQATHGQEWEQRLEVGRKHKGLQAREDPQVDRELAIS